MYKMLIIYSSSNNVSWSYTPGKTWPCHPTGFLRHHSPRLDSVPFEKLPAWHSASRKTKRLVVLKRSANTEWAFLNYSNVFFFFRISDIFLFLVSIPLIQRVLYVDTCCWNMLKLCWFGLSWRNVISVWWNVLAYSPSQVALFITCILK